MKNAIGFIATLVFVAVLASFGSGRSNRTSESPLWRVYDDYLKKAKYVDLTHAITPSIPVWAGFGPSKFLPATNPASGKPYTYDADGFEATHYDLSTDQLGTQLDPPAHWNPSYPAIDELPPTYTVRPLVTEKLSSRWRSSQH